MAQSYKCATDIMSAILDQLHTDHIHTAQLLDALENQLERVNRWNMHDFDLMLDMVEYLTQYSDDLHHPRENLIYARLSQRCRDLDDTLIAIVEEHDSIARRGLELRECLMSIRAGAIVSQETVCREFVHYVQTLREHMNIEETKLFPTARALLAPADWTAIEATFADKADPLFGPASEKRYERLWQFLQGELTALAS